MQWQRKSLEVEGGQLSVMHAERPAAPRLVLGHANGFNASTYRQFLSYLSDDFEILAPDLRGHGLSQAPAEPGQLRDWHIFARDLARLTASEPDRQTIFVGHSMGSICGLLAAASHGMRVDQFALIEPVFMPSWFYAIPHIPGGAWAYQFNPMSKSARERRARWESRNQVLQSYRDKKLFAHWTAGALEDYLETGLMDSGGETVLACAPEWEAAIFASHAHNPWSALRQIDVPVSLLKSSRRGSTVYPVWRLRRYGLTPDATQAGHLAPMEDPQGCAQWVLAQASTLLRSR